jgi:hypothetical protein
MELECGSKLIRRGEKFFFSIFVIYEVDGTKIRF